MVALRVETKPDYSDTLTTAKRVNTGSYRFVRLRKGRFMGLKIRCPKGRAGATPALGTTRGASFRRHATLTVNIFKTWTNCLPTAVARVSLH